MWSFEMTYINKKNVTMEQQVMQTIYWVEWFAVIILIGLSYQFEEKIIFKQLAYIITSLRSLVRLFDFEESQYINKAGEKTIFKLE